MPCDSSCRETGSSRICPGCRIPVREPARTAGRRGLRRHTAGPPPRLRPRRPLLQRAHAPATSQPTRPAAARHGGPAASGHSSCACGSSNLNAVPWAAYTRNVSSSSSARLTGSPNTSQVNGPGHAASSPSSRFGLTVREGSRSLAASRLSATPEIRTQHGSLASTWASPPALIASPRPPAGSFHTACASGWNKHNAQIRPVTTGPIRTTVISSHTRIRKSRRCLAHDGQTETATEGERSRYGQN
jgi:hypothetical protein